MDNPKSVDMDEKMIKNDEEVEYNVIITSQKNIQPNDVKPKINSSYRDENETDPYGDTSSISEYMISNNDEVISTMPIKSSDYLAKKIAKKLISKNDIHEQRILAEIEYFREKAAYYRMQKNLVALQARKIKYELEH